MSDYDNHYPTTFKAFMEDPAALHFDLCTHDRVNATIAFNDGKCFPVYVWGGDMIFPQEIFPKWDGNLYGLPLGYRSTSARDSMPCTYNLVIYKSPYALFTNGHRKKHSQYYDTHRKLTLKERFGLFLLDVSEYVFDVLHGLFTGVWLFKRSWHLNKWWRMDATEEEIADFWISLEYKAWSRSFSGK